MTGPVETTPKRYGAATAYMIAVAVILLDQAIKNYVQQALHLERLVSIPFIGPLRLTWVQNHGVTFGMFGGHADLSRWGLAAFAAVIAIALAVWARTQTRLLILVGIGLLIGGAVGNLIDRVRLGGVIDFFDASALMFPWVFNFADICVDTGVALLLIDSLMGEKKGPKGAKSDAAS